MLKYQQSRIAELKENYYPELSDTLTNFNDKNNTPLSNVNIKEAILIFMREDEEGAITDTSNVTADICSLASRSQRENPNAIFASEKLEKSDDLVDTVKDTTIEKVRYELNTETMSDAQVDLANQSRHSYSH